MAVTPPIDIQQQNAQQAAQSGGVVSSSDWTTIRVPTGRKVPTSAGMYKSLQETGFGLRGTESGQEYGPSGVKYYQNSPEFISAGEMVNQWYSMDGTDRNRYKDTFALMGLVNPQRATDADYFSAWAGYVQQVAGYAQNGNYVTIGDLMDADLKKREEQDPGLAELMRTGKRTTTQTSTSLQLSTKLDAQGMASAAAKALLGREATPDESAKLLGALNSYENANPQTTVSTREEDMYGNVLGGNSTTTGGVTDTARQELAKEQAQANPEYGAYQAATTFKNALMDLVYGKGY